MPTFLRRAKRRDGAMYSDLVGSDVVVQVARVRGEEVECLEVRKPLRGAKGEAKQKIIEAAKAEALALYHS